MSNQKRAEDILNILSGQDNFKQELNFMAETIKAIQREAIELAREKLCAKISENFDREPTTAKFSRFIKEGFLEIVNEELTINKIFGEK